MRGTYYSALEPVDDVEKKAGGRERGREGKNRNYRCLPVLTLPPQELIDVDFEFFDPIADIDWHGVKRLLAQLLQADAPLFNLNLLTDLILSQPLVGSTVKCDGRESDPYAFLSVLNLNIHAVRPLSRRQPDPINRLSLKDHPSIKSLTEYLISKANQSSALRVVLEDALASSSENHVGLILSERLVNMPVQVIPPMYRMLADEIKWAIEEVSPPLAKICVTLIHGQNEPFNFKYYLIMARTYHLSPEELDNLGHNPDRSKRRKGQIGGNDTPRFFHPEDEQFQQVGLSLSFRCLSLRARGVGIDAFHSLSVRERSTKRSGCLWA